MRKCAGPFTADVLAWYTILAERRLQRPGIWVSGNHTPHHLRLLDEQTYFIETLVRIAALMASLGAGYTPTGRWVVFVQRAKQAATNCIGEGPFRSVWIARPCARVAALSGKSLPEARFGQAAWPSGSRCSHRTTSRASMGRILGKPVNDHSSLRKKSARRRLQRNIVGPKGTPP